MLARLAAALATGEIMEFIARLRRRVLFYLLAVVLALCGLGFLVGALYILAQREWGSLYASLWFGIGFLVLAGLTVLIVRMVGAVRSRRAARRRNTEMRTLAGTAAIALLPTLLARSRLVVLAPLAAALGYAIFRENRRPDPDDEAQY